LFMCRLKPWENTISLWRKMCGYLLIKNSFVSSNGFFKLKNMDWSFDWNITKWKKLYWFTSKFVIVTQYIM
jgi:hypothetical protein